MSTLSSSPFDFDVSAWGQLPKLRGLFVTGTDTEVGKTMVAGAIARHLHVGPPGAGTVHQYPSRI